MAAEEPQTAVATTFQALGIDPFSWEPRSAKYWRTKMSPHAEVAAEVVKSLQETAQDEELVISQS